MAIEQNDILDDFDPDGNFLDHVLPENMCQHLTVSELNDKNLNPDQFSLINYNICSFQKIIFEMKVSVRPCMRLSVYPENYALKALF